MYRALKGSPSLKGRKECDEAQPRAKAERRALKVVVETRRAVTPDVIPRLLFRVVPEQTSDELELAWEHACRLHPDWLHVTYRDPLDPGAFPLTSAAWHRCVAGAQLAGLVRLEALLDHGGIYLDSDVELFRKLTSLTPLKAFAAWEDRNVIPDAVLGAEPRHHVIRQALEIALDRVDEGPWASGPGATTAAFRGADDVLVLPPASFYPYHYSELARASERWQDDPWCFGVHRWAGSWL